MVELSGPVVFETASGGSLRVIDRGDDFTTFGLTADGFAFWDDLAIDATVPMTLQVGDSYDAQAKVTHLTGDPVLRFDLTSRQPNGVADVRLTGLKPEAWYRLQFDGALAKTATGRAHGQTDATGVITFTGVTIPNG